MSKSNTLNTNKQTNKLTKTKELLIWCQENLIKTKCGLEIMSKNNPLNSKQTNKYIN